MDMGHLLLLLLLLWSSELQAEGNHNSEVSVRLVGGVSRCAGTLEVKHQGEWRQVSDFNSIWTLKTADVVCRELGCGSAVSVGQRKMSLIRSVWRIWSDCVQSGSTLRECAASVSSSDILDLTCSDSVRLVNGTSLCSGRLEVKTNQSTQRWSSVCEADFDQQDAEVVCRELGCGAPSVLQGALYGEVEAPIRTKEFQCGGHESALLDCRNSASDGNVTCSPGKAVGLTCSEPVRLVGGLTRCTGSLEVKHQGDWRPVIVSGWTVKVAAVACRELGCPSPVSVGPRKESSVRSVWMISSDCVESGSTLRECAESDSYSSILNIICSGSQMYGPTLHDSDPRPFIIRAVVLLLTLLLVNAAFYFYYKASRRQQTDTQEGIELHDYNLGKRKELREQSSTSKELISHPGGF